MAAPAKFGGLGDYEEEVKSTFADPVARKDRTFDQVAEQVWSASKLFPDNIVRVRGLPPFYQWEGSPQPSWMPTSFFMYSSMIALLKAADGVMIGTLVDLEPESFKGVEEFYGQNGKREILALGPQLPRQFFTPTPPKPTALAATETSAQDDCIAFLDRKLQAHGPKSALYISFGTIAWPIAPTHMPVLLDALLDAENETPFVLTTPGSLISPLSQELVDKVHKSGRGIIVEWAPQQAILSHPALGWVLTHGGGNTIFEALSTGTPLIVWPLFGDQPLHALWLSEALGVAYELVQTRTSPAARLAYRGGLAGTGVLQTDEALGAEIEEVLRKCRGADGTRVRRNAQRAREIISEANAVGGQVEQHLHKLRKYL